MKITLNQGLSGINYQFSPNATIDTKSKGCPLSEADAKRLVDNGIAKEVKTKSVSKK